MERIVGDVAALRGLPPLRPISFRLVGQERVSADFSADLARDADTGEMARRKRYWATVGLIPWDLDLLAHYRDLYGQVAAGYYEDEERGVRVVARPMLRSEITEIAGLLTWRDKTYGETLAHEVVHALQDQHFGLERLQEGRGTDGRNARRALVEGDAFLAAFQYDRPLVFTDVRRLTRLVERTFRSVRGGGRPSFVEAGFLFPYVQGTRFAAALWDQGGWAAVNGAYAAPPDSTSQVLHPERYLAREPIPPPQDLEPVRALLADRWESSVEEAVGEFAIRYLLSGVTTAAEAKSVAAQWRGDRVLVLDRRAGGGTALVWTTRWANAEAAERFADLYGLLAKEQGRDVDADAFGQVALVTGGLDAADVPKVRTLALGGAGVLRRTPPRPPLLEPATAVGPATDEPVQIRGPLGVSGYDRRPLLRHEGQGTSLSLGGLLQYRLDRLEGAATAHRLPRAELKLEGTVEPLLKTGFLLRAELSPDPDEPTLQARGGGGAVGVVQDAAIRLRLTSVGLADAGSFAFGRLQVPLLLEGATEGGELPLSRRSLLYDRLLAMRDLGFFYSVDYSGLGLPAGLEIALGQAVQGARLGLLGPRRPAPGPRAEGGLLFAAQRGRDDDLRDSALLGADLALRWRGWRFEGMALLVNPGEDGPVQYGWSALAGLQPLADFLELLVRWDRLRLPEDVLSRADEARLTAGVVLHYLPGRFKVEYDQEWELPEGGTAGARTTSRFLISLGF